MDWKTLSSSLIDSAAWDEDSRTLYVQFHQGRKYAYQGVDARTAERLFYAPSAGKHFHKSISPYYDGLEITEEE